MVGRVTRQPSDKMTEAEASKFGATLKLWRELNGLSGDVLAAELGTDKHQLSRIENGYRLPVAKAIRYAEHIGMDLDDMTFAYCGYRVRLTRIE